MKILVIKNKLSFDIAEDITKTLQYFSTRLPFPVIFEFKDADISISIKPYKTFQGYNPITGQPGVQTLYGLTDNIKDICKTLAPDNLYDMVILAWNIDTIPAPTDGSITSFTTQNPLYQNTDYIQLAINQYLKNKGDIWIRLSHEILHALCFKANRVGFATIDEMDVSRKGAFYNNDFPENPDSNFGFTLLNLQPYLKSLNRYKYFSETEVIRWKLKPELWVILDKMREIAATPFIITSGLRTPQENANVGGKPNSAHLRGLAVDITCTDNFKRSKMLKGIMPFQDKIFLEIAKAHLHIDIDPSIHAMGQVMLSEDE